MRRVKLTAIAAITASGLVGLGLAASGTAHAGTKGQQIRVCSADGDYRQVVLEGNNQNGEYEKVSNAFARGCTPISGGLAPQAIVGRAVLTDQTPAGSTIRRELPGAY